MNVAQLHTPLGRLGITEDNGAIVGLDWQGENSGTRSEVLKRALRQLEAYFAGALDQFDLPLDPPGSAFQKQVCAAMCDIPFGETRTYGDLAQALGAPPQAIGQACGGNPIPVIIPCHRVVGADGLGGFSGAGGVETKVALLRHEGAYGLLI